MDRLLQKQTSSFRDIADRINRETAQREMLLKPLPLLLQKIEEDLAPKLLDIGATLVSVHGEQMTVSFTPAKIDRAQRQAQAQQMRAKIEQLVKSTLSEVEVGDLTLEVLATRLSTHLKSKYEVNLSLGVLAKGVPVKKKAVSPLSTRLAGAQKPLEWCFREAFPRNDMRAIADCLNKVTPSNLTVKRFDNDIDLVKGNDSVCYFHATINGVVLMESLLKRVSSDPDEAAAWVAKMLDKHRSPSLYGRPLSRVAKRVLRAHLRRRP